MSQPNPGQWVSVNAVAWALDDAPCPADLLATLVAIARRADEQGRGSRQTVTTIATKTGKSPKQARRDIVRLKDLGLIVDGDQTLVAHLPAGQRPAVYDLPLSLKGPKPIKESRNITGLPKTRPEVTPPMDATPPFHGSPPLEGSPTPPTQGSTTPPMEGRQNKPLNNPSEKPSSSSSGRSPSIAYVADLTGADDDEAELILKEIKTRHQPRSLGAYVRKMPADDLAEILNEVRAKKADAKPDWCGKCDLPARTFDREGSYGQGIVAVRCPDCNPIAIRAKGDPWDGRRVSTAEGLTGWDAIIAQQESTSDKRATAALQAGERVQRRVGGYRPYRNSVDQSAYDQPFPVQRDGHDYGGEL